jgi:hypothetical protein
MDNLQGITYQTFEQDPVKYQKYEEVSDDLIDSHNKDCPNYVLKAMYAALSEWPQSDEDVRIPFSQT